MFILCTKTNLTKIISYVLTYSYTFGPSIVSDCVVVIINIGLHAKLGFSVKNILNKKPNFHNFSFNIV